MKKKMLLAMPLIAIFALTNCGGNPTPSPTYYNVKWLDYDSKILAETSVLEGEIPSFIGTPTRPTDWNYSYTFSGWLPELKPATDDVVYVAQYDSIQLPSTSLSISFEHLSTPNGKFGFEARSTKEPSNVIEVLIDWGDGTEVEKDTFWQSYRFYHEYDDTSRSYNIEIKGAIDDISIKYYDDNKYNYKIKNVVLGDSIKSFNFRECYYLQTISIPNSVTSIPSEAFYECDSLSSIVIPNSVTSIGSRAFSKCYSLASITIPDSVISIGGSAFSDCVSLASIIIPSSVTSIGNGAFAGCVSLASIIIPSSVISIEDVVFYSCKSLAIYCETKSKPSGWDPEWNTYYGSIKCPVIWGCIGNGECNNLKYGFSSIDENKSIGITGLVDKTATEAIIPSTIKINKEDVPVTTISDSAFKSSSLESITISNNVISIGSYTFYKSYSFNSIDLTDCDHVVSAGRLFLLETNISAIKVKTSLVKEYKSAPNWSEYAGKIIGV